MNITTLTAKIRGLRPMLHHNGQLRDPMNPHTRAIKSLSGKARGKNVADDDILALYRAEFAGALYYDDKLGPVVPADNLQAMLVEGARKRKLGKQVEALVQVVEPLGSSGYKLEYKGPRDVDGMFADERYRFVKSAKVNSSLVMRVRPRFPEWALTFEIEISDGGPATDQIEDALNDAGMLVGLCDWTPRYGRFELESLKVN